MAISKKIREALILKSGGMCYLCKQKTEVNNINIREIAHIESQGVAGPRSNKNKKDVNEIRNLLVLCPTCHTIIDKNADLYTVNYLRKIKYKHEAKVSSKLNFYNRDNDEDKKTIHTFEEYSNISELPKLIDICNSHEISFDFFDFEESFQNFLRGNPLWKGFHDIELNESFNFFMKNYIELLGYIRENYTPPYGGDLFYRRSVIINNKIDDYIDIFMDSYLKYFDNVNRVI